MNMSAGQLVKCMTAECNDTHWAHVHPTSKICTYKTTNEYTNSRDYGDYFLTYSFW